MNDSIDNRSPIDAPGSPRRGLFDQTWEVELLISGALVFALLGAPTRLSGWWDRVSVIAAGDLRMGYFFAYYYLSLLAYALIATFVLHIAARAYWVGLAGLHSLYPEGIRWDAVQNRGPIGLALAKRLVPSLEEAVRNADGFCRLIFAFAAILVGNLVLSIVGVFAIGVPSYWIVTYAVPGSSLLVVAAAMAVVVWLLPFVGALLLDRKMRERIAPDSRLAWAIRGILRLSYYVALGPVLHPLTLTIATRTSQRRFATVLQTIGAVVVAMFLVSDLDLFNGGTPFDSLLLGPGEGSSAELVPAYYADQRLAGAIHRRSPAIQSEVIEGDYVRLFIPYYPRDDNELLRERCESVVTRVVDGEPDDAAAARCIGDLYEVSMNGAAVSPEHFDFATDRASGMRGVVARLNVAAFPPGRHELRLVRDISAARRGAPS